MVMIDFKSLAEGLGKLFLLMIVGIITIIYLAISAIYETKLYIQIHFAKPMVLKIDAKSQMPIFDVNASNQFKSNEFIKAVGNYPYIVVGGRFATIFHREIEVTDDPDVKNAKKVILSYQKLHAYIPSNCMDKVEQDLTQHENAINPWIANYRLLVDQVKYEITPPKNFVIKETCKNVILVSTDYIGLKPDEFDEHPSFENTLVHECAIENNRWNGHCSEQAKVYKSTLDYFDLTWGINTVEVSSLDNKIQHLNKSTIIRDVDTTPTESESVAPVQEIENALDENIITSPVDSTATESPKNIDNSEVIEAELPEHAAPENKTEEVPLKIPTCIIPGHCS